MKKYITITFLFIAGVLNAQIDLNKAKEQLEKVEKAIIPATTNTTTTPTTTPTTPKTTTTPVTTTTAPSTTTTAPATTTTTTTTTKAKTPKEFLASLTDGEVATGLKEALTQGATKASKSLNVVDGFYKNPKVKIPFPEQVSKVANELRKLGYGSKIDDFEMTLNRSAEQAAVEAAPILKTAITGMSIKDAKKILISGDTAATGYLRKKTYNSLYASFTPHIKKALGDNQVTSKWEDIIKIYNKIPFVKKADTDLAAFTTTKALKGVFVLIAEEETKIRKNPVNQTTDSMKKIFGSFL